MKAVCIYKYGGPEVLVYEDAPCPHPGEGEVLVKVHAAGVNPVDWKIREGYLQEMLHSTLPLILGWDVSGVVTALGTKLLRLKEGDEVFSHPDVARDGAYADYIVIKESEVALKPRSIDHIHAAAMPLAGLTAWQTLFDAGGLETGQRVLIHAAAGGVGSVAVQLAKWKGAVVIGTASEQNHDFLRKLGIDQVIDYARERFEEGGHPWTSSSTPWAGKPRSAPGRCSSPAASWFRSSSPPSRKKRPRTAFGRLCVHKAECVSTGGDRPVGR